MMRNTTFPRLWRKLDWVRAIGIATAILVNFAVMAALTMPPTRIPMIKAHASETTTLTPQAPEADDYLHWVELPIHPPPMPMRIP